MRQALGLKKTELCLLGPTNSTVLQGMIEKGRSSKPLNIEVFSPWATVPHQALGLEQDDDWSPKLHRQIATDDCTCRRLVHEIKLRTANFAWKTVNIVLISEWDTDYGRMLPKTFAKHCAGSQQPTLHHFKYLRGIDGRLPGEKTPDPIAAGTRPKSESRERPEGTSQLDYLRRLEQKLKALDKELRREEERRGVPFPLDRERIDAIGILGSDVYDKLLILRALKPSFRGTVFFTTDLDARLLHADDLEWTQNLVVGSAFGLQLKKSLQNDIPPFRGSYQTSVFYHMLMALGHEAVNWSHESHPPTRIFEIGNGYAVNMDIDQPDPDGATCRACGTPDVFQDRCAAHGQDPHPKSNRHAWGLGPLRTMATSLPFLVFLFLAMPPVRTLKRQTKEFVIVGGTALLLVGLIVWIAFNDHMRPNGECFSLAKGISIWPTEMLRVIVILMSIWFALVAWDSLRRNTESLEKDFFDRILKVERLWQNKPWFERMKAGLSGLFFLPRDLKGDVKKLWSMYRYQRFLWIRLVRIAVYVMLWFALGFLLFSIFGFPNVPARGWWSFEVDKAVLTLSLIALHSLLFLVFDVTRACHWFVHQLLAEETRRWPHSRRSKAATAPLSPNDVDEWLSVRLIAEHTQVVGKLILAPFAVLLIMLLSRHYLLDAWDWPPQLVIVISLAFVIAACSALELRLLAKQARKRALRGLRLKLRKISRTQEKGRAEAVEQLIKEVEAERRGAFGGMVTNPVLGALLIPSGGLGVFNLLEHITH